MDGDILEPIVGPDGPTCPTQSCERDLYSIVISLLAIYALGLTIIHIRNVRRGRATWTSCGKITGASILLNEMSIVDAHDGDQCHIGNTYIAIGIVFVLWIVWANFRALFSKKTADRFFGSCPHLSGYRNAKVSITTLADCPITDPVGLAVWHAYFSGAHTMELDFEWSHGLAALNRMAIRGVHKLPTSLGRARNHPLPVFGHLDTKKQEDHAELAVPNPSVQAQEPIDIIGSEADHAQEPVKSFPNLTVQTRESINIVGSKDPPDLAVYAQESIDIAGSECMPDKNFLTDQPALTPGMTLGDLLTAMGDLAAYNYLTEEQRGKIMTSQELVRLARCISTSAKCGSTTDSSGSFPNRKKTRGGRRSRHPSSADSAVSEDFLKEKMLDVKFREYIPPAHWEIPVCQAGCPRENFPTHYNILHEGLHLKAGTTVADHSGTYMIATGAWVTKG